jgi:phage shock protein PspC (stress-responsive transcriptional regulator)
MNKVTTVNLNGNAYQLEETGYDTLRSYLEAAGRRLEGNPDKNEIIADIEQAIADKFRAILGAFKSVVSAAEVAQIVAEMGPVQDPSGNDAEPGPASQPAASSFGGAAPGGTPGGYGSAPGARKRLYKFKEGAMIGGVCNGVAVYFDIDVTIVRLIFALTTLMWGIGPIAYLLMLIIVPTAHTPEEKAAATGAPSTAEEFIRRAKEGYYEGMKTFGDRRAHREWRRKFKREMRGWSRDFKQDMREHAHEWRGNWHRYWAPTSEPNPAAWFALPFLWVLRAVLGFAAFLAVISLLSDGTVFGLLPPHGVPLWAGLLFIILVYQLLVWPLRALRWMFLGHSRYGAHPLAQIAGVLHSLVWLTCLVLLVWYANRHVPHFREGVEHLRLAAHQAVDEVQQWWDRPKAALN